MDSLFGACSMVVDTGIPQLHEVVNITVHVVRLLIKQPFCLHKQYLRWGFELYHFQMSSLKMAVHRRNK